MRDRELSQNAGARTRQMNHHLAAILLAGLPRDVSQLLQPVYQFHRAVMFQLQPLGQFADGRRGAVRQTLDGQQQLVLLGLHAGGPHLLLAEAEKSPDLIAEFGQRAVFFQR